MKATSTQLTSKRIEITAPFAMIEEKGTSLLQVSGFASMKGLDRQGDSVDPKLFDIPTFMANPQLWLNHGLYTRPDTGTEVPIGTVENAFVVRIRREGSSLIVVEAEDESKAVATFDFDEGSIYKTGDTGLWVEVSILEAEIAELVLDKRLNAFSWQGLIYKRPNGAIKKVDIMEVSLVFLPANARALFSVGKDMSFGTDLFLLSHDGILYPASDGFSPNSCKTTLDGTATYRAAWYTEKHGIQTIPLPISHPIGAALMALEKAPRGANPMLLRSTWKQTDDGAGVYLREDIDEVLAGVDKSCKSDILTADEASVLGLNSSESCTKDEEALLKEQGQTDEGEETMSQETVSKIESMFTSMTEALSAKFDTLVETMRTVTADTEKKEIEVPAPETKDAVVDADKETAGTDDAAAKPATSVVNVADKAEKSEEGVTSADMEKLASAMTTLLDHVDTQFKAMADEIVKMKGDVAPSQAKDTTDGVPPITEIRKHLQAQPIEVRKRADKTAMADVLFPLDEAREKNEQG